MRWFLPGAVRGGLVPLSRPRDGERGRIDVAAPLLRGLVLTGFWRLRGWIGSSGFRSADRRPGSSRHEMVPWVMPGRRSSVKLVPPRCCRRGIHWFQVMALRIHGIQGNAGSSNFRSPNDAFPQVEMLGGSLLRFRLTNQGTGPQNN